MGRYFKIGFNTVCMIVVIQWTVPVFSKKWVKYLQQNDIVISRCQHSLNKSALQCMEVQ